MILDFLASLSFYIIPYLTGRVFTKKIVPAYLIGALFWFVLFFALSFAHSILKFDFPQAIRLLIVGVCAASLLKIFKERPKIDFNLKEKGLIFVLVFSSLLYFFVFVRNTPYPLSLNWDIYEHIALSNLISQGKIDLLTTNISDTFSINSYSAIFHVLLALPSILFQKGILGIYYFLSFWHYVLAAIAGFLIAKRISGDNLTAVISAVLSSLVFESIVVYSSFFLIPQNFAALLTIFLFIKAENLKPKLVILNLLGIFLMHYIVGLLCVFVLTSYLFSQRYNLSAKILNFSILGSLITLGALTGLNYFGNWQLIKNDEAVHFTFRLSEKLNFFADWYGAGLLIAFVLGVFAVFRKDDLNQKLALIFAIIILGLSLAPFSYFLKFYVLGRYFVNFIVALGISFLLFNTSKPLKILGLFLVLSSILIIFYKNQLAYKNPLHFKNFETQISRQEIETGDFLQQRGNRSSFLVSDPATQYILEALSGVNTQGGVYMNSKTRQNLINIYKSEDFKKVRDKILQIQDKLDTRKPDRIFFVVGGRYFAWQKLSDKEKQSSFYNIWSPKELSFDDLKYINELANSPYFSLIYKNQELAILEVR